ncbi:MULTISPECIES: CBS domain-containing protein [unclassified Bradyrhizobium]|uniref:CBS domain-containing protein n=1 Tax=unclassified Bradyrhizobium TaxID=2631580 RepID=UPI0024799483|nr:MULTISPECIES: CBS domain-containing protein [unclassified Bradyrhizobium]WGR71367.1 CBS domain-containing protein [Bradyrhizobium sp. ISRA426]WGR76202.1 CBS domain-containing protein [Bradyrhizobium sp. ISRA430]WGR86607.1 CBS domain-containing protein [Bradyrhizobium sp. ISRA432]
MLVREAMTTEPKVVNPQDTIQSAAELMSALGVGFLPVGADDRLVGMITDRDIAIRAIGKGRGPETPVAEAMTADVMYCFEDEDVEAACQSMGDLQVRRLPVLNSDKRLVGVIALGDVARKANGSAGVALAQISEPGGEHTQF